MSKIHIFRDKYNNIYCELHKICKLIIDILVKNN